MPTAGRINLDNLWYRGNLDLDLDFVTHWTYRSIRNRKTENSWYVPYSIKANLFCEQHGSYV